MVIITVEKFAKMYVENNPGDKFNDIKSNLKAALRRKKAGAVCANYLYTLEDYELDIFNKFVDVTKENNVPIKLQQVIILRLIKSIEQVLGGRFGRRNYLEMLRGMLTKTGRMADLFKD